MFLGYDIGGSKCAVVPGKQNDHDIVIRSKKVFPTHKPIYEMIEALFTCAENLLIEEQLSISGIEGIGISCGGPLNSKEGIIVAPPNLPGWLNIPIVSLTEKRHRIKAFI